MKSNIPLKKAAIIGGVCVVLLAGLVILIPRVSTQESPGEDDGSYIAEDVVSEDSSEESNDLLPTHDTPDETGDETSLSDYDIRLSEDKTKYGVTEISGTFTTFVNLNFREGPSKKYDIISTSPKGSKISIIGRASNGWYQVVIDNTIGYMCDDYLDGQGKLVLNTFDMDKVVKLALKKATASGDVKTIDDWLEERVNSDRISPEEYTLLSTTGKGSYYCASFDITGENFCTCDGTTLTNEDEIAEYLVSRFIDDEVKYCYFENHGTYKIGGKTYYEVRCYTRTGQSDFAKSVEENASSSEYDDGYTFDSDYEDIDSSDDSADSAEDSEEEIDYNNVYTE